MIAWHRPGTAFDPKLPTIRSFRNGAPAMEPEVY